MRAQLKFSREELRRFGLILASGVALMLGVVVPGVRRMPFPLWPWVVAATLVGLALLVPRALVPIHIIWDRVTHFINWTLSHLALALIYYVVVMPMGLATRFAGKDLLKRRFERHGQTYRVPSQIPDSKHMEKPF